MITEWPTCDSCGLEMIGGKCLTRWCDERAELVDEVLGGDDDA